KQPGDLLCGGTLNLDAACWMETTATPAQGTLARLIALVRNARETRGHYQRLADRLAAWVFPLVALIALVAASFHAWRDGWNSGLLTALAVVLVACPCALGLATPLALWAGLGLAARRHVLFRDGEAVERLAAVRAVYFDKTGTLSTGRAAVTQLICNAETTRRTVLDRGAALAAGALHPFSLAVARFAAKSGVPIGSTPGKLHAIPGRGVIGSLPDSPDDVCALGNRRLIEESGFRFPSDLETPLRQVRERGDSYSLIGWQGLVRGVFVFSEELRPGIADLLAWCRSNGLETAILTGDNAARGARLAEQLGVPVHADLLPEDKVAFVRAARARGLAVAMVGDGVNDAPALAASDVGIALGCGTDVSRDSAAVCLLGDDPTRLIWAIEFSPRAVRTIRGNLFWAFVYNGAGLGLACTGKLNPAIAALLMVVSSCLIVFRALAVGRDAGSAAGAAPAIGPLPIEPEPHPQDFGDIPELAGQYDSPLDSSPAPIARGALRPAGGHLAQTVLLTRSDG
ncbi:MAG: heavy metal translocating P-type ATPase, partial [Planctomycetales bacterium]